MGTQKLKKRYNLIEKKSFLFEVLKEFLKLFSALYLIPLFSFARSHRKIHLKAGQIAVLITKIFNHQQPKLTESRNNYCHIKLYS